MVNEDEMVGAPVGALIGALVRRLVSRLVGFSGGDGGQMLHAVWYQVIGCEWTICWPREAMGCCLLQRAMKMTKVVHGNQELMPWLWKDQGQSIATAVLVHREL